MQEKGTGKYNIVHTKQKKKRKKKKSRAKWSNFL